MKCIHENFVLTSDPPQYKCKNCGQTWYCNQSTPLCKDNALIIKNKSNLACRLKKFSYALLSIPLIIMVSILILSLIFILPIVALIYPENITFVTKETKNEPNKIHE